MKYLIILAWLLSLTVAPQTQAPQSEDTPRLLYTIEASDPILIEWHPEHDWIAHYKIVDGKQFVSTLDLTTLNTLFEIPVTLYMSFTWSPDGAQLATNSLGSGNQFDLSIWTIVTEQQDVTAEKVQSFEIDWKTTGTDEGAQLAWHPLDSLIALHDGNTLYYIHLDTDEIEIVESVSPGGGFAAWSPDGHLLALAVRSISILDYDSNEIVLNIDSGELPGLDSGPPFRYIPPARGNQSMSWSPDGRALAFFYSVRGETQGIYALDVDTQELKYQITHNMPEVVNAIAWSPDGTMIASVGHARFCETDCENLIHIWDAESLDLLYRINGHSDAIVTVSWSPDSRRFATGSQDSTIRIWEISAID